MHRCRRIAGALLLSTACSTTPSPVPAPRPPPPPMALEGPHSRVAGDALRGTEVLQAFSRACKGNDGEACRVLGLMHRLGFADASDLNFSAQMLVRACTLEDARGCNEAGAAHVAGRGIKRDTSAAKAMFDAACRLGDPQGCERADALYEGNLKEPAAEACPTEVTLDRAFAWVKDRIAGCYQEALDDDPRLAGHFNVLLLLDAEGRLLAAGVTDSTLKDPPMERCVLNQVLKVRYPACPSGQTALVIRPFTFKAQAQ